MLFTFTESDFQGDLRFGGSLAITAENVREVSELIGHFRLFPDTGNADQLRERIAALESGTLSHVIESDKRPVYEVSRCLDFDFTAPYKKWASECFGYEDTFPDLEIPRKWHGLKYTNYQARLYTNREHICFEAYATAEPWNKKTAHEYATSRVIDQVGEEFGTRRSEPEFIQNRNGTMSRNPDYLRRHAATPSASNARLKRAFFTWWMENHANAAQKAIVQGNADISRDASYMNAFTFERHESHIYYAKSADGYKSMSFTEFARTGK